MKNILFNEAILRFIRGRCSKGYEFWIEDLSSFRAREIPIQDHADIVYSLFLLGLENIIRKDAAEEFVDHLLDIPLHGRDISSTNDRPVNAHLTAYALGAVRLLFDKNIIDTPVGLTKGWDIYKIVDRQMLPIWPKIWSHHIWRVSHWIGGVPSILLQLSRYGHSEVDDYFIHEVLNSCEKSIIDKKSGRLLTYKSDLIQKIFKFAYNIRHDPDLGEIGGVVHLLWIYHALGRPYVGKENLFESALMHMQRTPFIESMPYCLDFDVVQLARTSFHSDSYKIDNLKKRSDVLNNNIFDFLIGDIPDKYTLHKLPGAIATMHECSIITGSGFFDAPPIDIIKRAYWI